ncbi:MAG: MFS transporter [Proteobacteria bacterium]|nr:MFS transporter [Pseudomonadota bacterium]
MSPAAHLALINFFTGDIQGGLGPFLATWLAANGHWSPARVGSVMTVVGLFALMLNGPAGALVDHTRYPRLLLGLACGAILGGTLLIVPAPTMVWVLASQFLTGAGGALLLPALTLLTLGIVGKRRFPRQQGRNQAFNHAGIVFAAVLIAASGPVFGLSAPFWIFGSMAFAAIIAVAITPLRAFNGRRAHGWAESEPDHVEHRSSMRQVVSNPRLLLLAGALGLFNLANGYMLALVGQRLVATGHDATGWIAVYVIVAQLTMIPVALWAGSLADQAGRRRLLLLACVVLPVRAVFSGLVTDPSALMLAEVLDGVSSGLIGVAVPVVVADLTWGSGRTQTALGALNTLQGIGGALSGLFGGMLVSVFNWNGAFLALAVPAVAAAALALWLQETRDVETPFPPGSAPAAGPAASGPRR